MKLFHGTSSKKQREIRRKGLRAERYVAGADGVWLSDQYDMAEWFAGIKTDEEGGKNLICEVEVKEKNLTADLVSYEMPSYEVLDTFGCDTGDIEKSTVCWRKKIDNGEVPFPKNRHDWKTSLNTVHSVIAIKPIPRNKIKCEVKE
jgi:hypothetical protein